MGAILAVAPVTLLQAEDPIALNAGLPARFDPAPNYRLCTDEGDIWQLSDGSRLGQPSRFEGAATNLPEMLPGMTGEERASISLWGRKSSVGWVHPRQPILITFDLKKRERIGRLLLSSAAGASGVYWPTAVAIAVSDDGEQWAYVDDVISSTRHDGLPAPMRYSAHLFRTGALNVEGRYVALCVFPGSTSMFFTDEIVIEAGDRGAPERILRPIGTAAELRKYVQTHVTPHLLARRLAMDADLIAQAISGADGLSAQARGDLVERLQALRQEQRELPHDLPEPLRTVIPIVPAQAALLALHGELLQALGYPPLLATKAHRNAYLGWLRAPEEKTQSPVQLSFRQMRDEVRSDLFLLTNATPAPQTVRLTASDATGLALSYCPWTDTPQLEPVATALLPAKRSGERWEVELPPGVTTKLYLTANAAQLSPGRETRRLKVEKVEGSDEPLEVVVQLDIAPIAMGPGRLHLGMWDYTNHVGYDSLTPENRDAAISLMRSHGVDSPWATSRVTPMPEAADFDQEDMLQRFPDYTELDRWIARWPGARRYMVFVNVGDGIGGVSSDSPRFARRVTQWAKHLADHVVGLGLQPGQLHLCLVDEPNNDAKEKRALAWSKPIRENVPGLTLWSNPVSPHPGQSANPALYTVPQVLCANLGVARQGGYRAWSFYRSRGKSGQGQELYLCSALAPHTDPNGYFRLLALAGWRLRIQGIGFWAFNSQGGLSDAFAAYSPAKSAIWYSPAFLHPADATDTLQWQAVRESLLDYEYFRALEKVLPSITDPATREAAEALISDAAINALIDTRKPGDGDAWADSSDWDAPDRHRLKILSLLQTVSAPLRAGQRPTSEREGAVP